VQGPGRVSFWWKVSSEATFDRLRFCLDGGEKARISGEVDWSPVTFPIASGDHTLRWSYDKDGNYRAGSDRGWLDQVVLTRAAETAAQLALSIGSGNRISLTLPTPSSTGFVVEYRDSLGSEDPWKVLDKPVATAKGTVVSDFVQTNRSRFYRVRVQANP
jgi:hypothetical protein